MRLPRTDLPQIRAATVRVCILAVPAVLVNVVAASGWVFWAQDEFEGAFPSSRISWGAALVLAAAVESIAVYLAYEAHQARMAGDAGAFLRLAAYVIAAGSGALNYAHWISASESLAIILAVMSAGSPWLWSVRSQSIHRDQLRNDGLIEPRAVRLSRARWLLWLPQTWRVQRLSVWYGETDPVQAIRRFGTDPLTGGSRTAKRLQFGSLRPWRWSVVTTLHELPPVDAEPPVIPAPALTPPPPPVPVRAVAARTTKGRRGVTARTPERSFEEDAADIYRPGMGWSNLAGQLRERGHQFGNGRAQAEHARLKAAEVKP